MWGEFKTLDSPETPPHIIRNMDTNEKRIPKEKAVILKTKPSFIPVKKRKSSPLNKWIKETKNSYQVTRQDICYIYRNIIFAKSFGELKAIMENEETRDSYPVLVIAIIAGVLGDIARGNVLNLTRMISFIFPESSKGFDFNEITSDTKNNGYDAIVELEEALRRLEGDDSLMIIDKLVMAQDASYEVKND